MKLTKNQKEYILEAFFENDYYAGWKGIATTLIEKGSCIVAGDKCIWSGFIGNFIKTKKAENAIDCLIYEFDLKAFISSDFFSQIQHNDVVQLQIKIDEMQGTCDEIKSIKVN